MEYLQENIMLVYHNQLNHTTHTISNLFCPNVVYFSIILQGIKTFYQIFIIQIVTLMFLIISIIYSYEKDWNNIYKFKNKI